MPRSAALTLLGIVTLLSGCTPAPLQAPAPIEISSNKSPADVVRAASQVLAAQGFEISTADAAGGLLVARRVRSVGEQGPAIHCRFASNSMAGERGESAFQVNVTARPATTGSALSIASTVVMDYSQLPGMYKRPNSSSDCITTGTIEKSLIAAVQ